MKVEVLSCEKIKEGYIVKLKDGNEPFYMDGKGGQLGDRGTIGESIVLEVKDGSILVDKEVALGEQECSINMERRKDIASQHTAQHLFSALAYNDYQLNTMGFRMAEEYTTVDLDSNTITEETIKELENKANEVIRRAIELKIYTLNHEEAMKIEGLRKAIKDKVTGDVRFVEIPDTDLGACAGFHVENTKDIKLFKILSHEKIKGNYTRFFFIAGDRALKDYAFKHELSKELCHIFSCKDHEILTMLNKSLEEKKKIETEMKMIASEFSELLGEKLMKEAEEINGYKFIIYVGDKTTVQYLPRHINPEEYLLITGSEDSYSIISNKINCKDFLKELTSANNNIKGGGNQIKGNFKGKISKEELKKQLETFLNKL
ncbi:alanyl-tRNA editing protein [Fusobacterium ulcerans]|uniref:alanyl-tRNA editing protein n=1 Tax=Fusobacterium ulcerans TaxID=861 RepID=UPI002E791C40|nr:alanyl-tRNA editing protein [Fusobacterium ulcerans]MEE0137118.1 alanyl-tRNA editing protein [Fusobacterium ulcerans]